MSLRTYALLLLPLFVIVALFGELHVDEGHYFASGSLILEGKIPYRDFIYVQAPLYPYVSACLQLLVGRSFTAARLAHGAIGFLALLAGGLIANRSGKTALLLYAGMTVPSLFLLYHFTFVKLYATAALLTTAAFLSFDRARYIPCLMFAALAAATRISLAPVFPVFALACLLLRGRRAIGAIASGIATLGIVFLPHAFLAFDQMRYDLFAYHFEKDAFSLTQTLVYKVDSFSKLAAHFWPLAIILTLAFSVPKQRPWRESIRRFAPVLALLAVVAVHLLAKGPNLHRYLVVIYPATAGLVARAAARRFQLLGRGLAFACLLLFAARLPAEIPETLDFSHGAPALRIDRVAADVRQATRPGDRIVSYMDAIPIAASRRNLERYEMNTVTYDPSWAFDRCRKFAVLRAEELEAALVDGRVTACLVTKDSFIGNFPRFYNPGERGIRPDIMAAIHRHFRPAKRYPGLGYFGADVDLYIRSPWPD